MTVGVAHMSTPDGTLISAHAPHRQEVTLTRKNIDVSVLGLVDVFVGRGEAEGISFVHCQSLQGRKSELVSDRGTRHCVYSGPGLYSVQCIAPCMPSP